MLYWLHRMFHGGGFWKYHAIHHSSEELDWISAARFHPVNLMLGTITVDVILLMAGISPNVMLWVGPFTTFHSAFVHANLNWTLGPFKYVLATPVFHRWHHTTQQEGRHTNFAGTFPVLNALNIMQLKTPQSAVLSAVIFNAVIIIALIPLALRGVKYRPMGAAVLLRNNLLIYGVGGIIIPFVGIKLIDMLITTVGLA